MKSHIRESQKPIFVKEGVESLEGYKDGELVVYDDEFFEYTYGNSKEGGIFADEHGRFYYTVNFTYDDDCEFYEEDEKGWDLTCNRDYGEFAIGADFTDNQAHQIASYLNEKYKVFEGENKLVCRRLRDEDEQTNTRTDRDTSVERD